MDFFSPFFCRRMKRSYTSSIRRSKRGQRDKANLSGSSCTIGSQTSRKASGMTNTSGASILYPGRMTAKDRRLLKMILVIFVSFVTCYLPITSAKIVRSFHNIHVINIMAYILIYLTPCINPIIYVVRIFMILYLHPFIGSRLVETYIAQLMNSVCRFSFR